MGNWICIRIKLGNGVTYNSCDQSLLGIGHNVSNYCDYHDTLRVISYRQYCY